MFCACPVVDSTRAEPNVAVCPVCRRHAGRPAGHQPSGRRAGLARGRWRWAARINSTSIFARKNYFYPDLPKGYQISQYETPLAVNGLLPVETPDGWRNIRIRRVHLEEDTGKLTHVSKDGQDYSLVDLNRAGVPLLEIVSEPDLHNAQEVRAYATGAARPAALRGSQLGRHGKGRHAHRAEHLGPAGGPRRAGHARRDQKPEQFPRAGTRRRLTRSNARLRRWKQAAR